MLPEWEALKKQTRRSWGSERDPGQLCRPPSAHESVLQFSGVVAAFRFQLRGERVWPRLGLVPLRAPVVFGAL